jgi:hypothetical protein
MATNLSIKKAYAQTEYTPESIQDLIRCKSDPVYFIEKFVKVQHPTKGILPMELYEYQKRMLAAIHEKKDTVVLASRQLGKTTVVAMYILWLTCFADDKLAVIASKAMNHATEIMSRIKFAYEELPAWLKPGCRYYSRTSIEFDNGSKIKSEATSEKTGRGGSPSCLDGSTKITLRNKETGEIQVIPIERILSLVDYLSELPRKGFYEIAGFQVLTGSGFKDFTGLLETKNSKTLKLEFSDRSNLICTPDHKIFANGEFRPASELLTGDIIDRNLKVLSLLPHCESQTVYDLVQVEDVHSYITNSVISHNCLFIDEIAFLNRRIQEEMWASIAPSLSTGGKFILTSTPNGDSDLFATIWRGANSGQNSFFPVKALWHEHPERDQKYYDEMKGKLGPVKVRQEVDCEFLSSDALLVDTRKLHSLQTKPPLFENMGFKFWKEVSGPNRMYLVGVDPATGTGSDFTAIEVFEFPSLEQVAELRLNTVNIPLIYAKIKWLLKHLRASDANRNSAEVLWTFERNGIGEALVAMLQNDDGEGVDIDGVNLYNENNGKFGCYTTGSSKLLACMQMKNLVERINNGLIINSDVLHFELQNYIAAGGSYAAKKGATDDTISATLLVIKLLKYLSGESEIAQKLVYENVAADSDLDTSLDGDQFGGEPVPFGLV